MNNPPFAIGQKVVCVNILKGKSMDDIIPLKKGNVYTVTSIEPHRYYLGKWGVGFKETQPEDKYQHDQFAPIITNYSSATEEILERFKQTDECPDKILIPETVNN